MPIKKAEGQTLLTLLRLVIVSIALLGSWGMQGVADAAFRFVFNAEEIVMGFLVEEEPIATVEGQLYVLYYDERDASGDAKRHVYKHYYLTGNEGAYGLKDSAGVRLLDERYEEILVLPQAYLLKEQGLWRFYDRELAQLSEAAWESVELHRDENGRISSDLVKIGMGGLYGAADLLGQILVEPVYEELDLYTFAAGWPINRVSLDGLFGYIDSSGQVVIDIIYDYAVMSSILVHDDDPQRPLEQGAVQGAETEAGAEAGAEAQPGAEAEEPAGREVPIVYVLKDGDWGGMFRNRDNTATAVNWDIEPAEQVVTDYIAGGGEI